MKISLLSATFCCYADCYKHKHKYTPEIRRSIHTNLNPVHGCKHCALRFCRPITQKIAASTKHRPPLRAVSKLLLAVSDVLRIQTILRVDGFQGVSASIFLAGWLCLYTPHSYCCPAKLHQISHQISLRFGLASLQRSGIQPFQRIYGFKLQTLRFCIYF